MTAVHTISRRSLLASGSAVAVVSTALATSRATPAAATRRPVRFVARGTSDFSIFVDDRETATTQHAATELADYLHQMSGAVIPVVGGTTRPSGPVIAIGHHNDIVGSSFPDVDASQLGDDGFAIRSDGDLMVITGATERGDLYGVYWFLDRVLGVRWYADDFTVVPTQTTITVPFTAINRDCIPRFRYREMLSGDATRFPEYRQHNLLNGNSLSNASYPASPELATWSRYWPQDNQHNFRTVITDESLWWPMPRTSNTQLKMMNPDTRSQAVTELVSRLQPQIGVVDSPIVGFAQMDGGDWPPDPESATLIAAHGGARSAAVIDLVNDVADGVAAQVPNARIGTFAYTWSFEPPTGLTVNDNVVLTVAPADDDQAQGHFEAGNASSKAAIETWAGLSDNIVLWDYLANSQSYVQPYPNWRAGARNIQALAALPSAQGYFGLAAFTSPGGDFGHLRTWVGARLAWDPTLDVDDLVDEFVEGYYGPAASQISAYLNLLEGAVADTGFRLRLFVAPVCPYLSYDVIRSADSLLEQASAAAAGDAAHARHVGTVRMGLDFVVLLRQSELRAIAAARGDSWDPSAGGRLTRLGQEITASGLVQNQQYKMPPARMLELVSATRTSPTIPAAGAGMPYGDWVTVYAVAANLTNAVTAATDPAASDGTCVVMLGSPADWGIQFPLSVLPQDGTWELHVSARIVESGAADDSVAFTVGPYPLLTDSELTVEVGEVNDGAFHEIRVPGTFSFDDSGRYLYIAAPNRPEVAEVRVDRLIAVRVA